MRKIIVKLVALLIFAFLVHILGTMFATPIDNTMALTQLEDSNASLAIFHGYQQYGALVKVALVFVVGLILFAGDIKNLFGGKAK